MNGIVSIPAPFPYSQAYYVNKRAIFLSQRRGADASHEASEGRVAAAPINSQKKGIHQNIPKKTQCQHSKERRMSNARQSNGGNKETHTTTT
jgi:hypothetical protein